MKDEKEPRILDVRLTKRAEKKTKTLEPVPLNLVNVDHCKAFSFKDERTWPFLIRFFLYPKPLGIGNLSFVRFLLFLLMIFFTIQVQIKGNGAWIVRMLYNLNLPTHELGHIVFQFPIPGDLIFNATLAPLLNITGEHVITSLGGSLFQIMVPLIPFFVLWLKDRDIFCASIALWWAFENFIDVAPYIEDAMYMRLYLITGGTGAEMPYGVHDWNYILSETRLLLKYDIIAATTYKIGYIGMWLSVAWSGWSLFYYWFYQRVKWTEL